MTNLGCLDAHLRSDATMLAVMKAYRSQLRKVSCCTLYYNARHTARMLRGVSTSVTDKNFHSVALPAFSIQVAELGRVLEEEAAALQRRKVLRSEMAALIATTNKFLHEQFDTLAFVMAVKHPEYYREWVVLRGDGSRKRRKTTRAKEENASGSNPAIIQTKRAPAGKAQEFKTVETATEVVTDQPDNKQSCDQPVFIPDELRKMLPDFIEKAVEERRFVPVARLRLIDPGMIPFTLKETIDQLRGFS